MNAMYPDPRTVDAQTVLENMWAIIEREQLDHVGYVDQEVDEELRASGAVCRGRRACAVGACWLAGGVEPVNDGCEWMLPCAGEEESERCEWLAQMGYYGILTAYEALNQAAKAYADEHGLEIASDWMRSGGPLEGLFETRYIDRMDEPLRGYLIEPRDMLTVVDRAKEIVAG